MNINSKINARLDGKAAYYKGGCFFEEALQKALQSVPDCIKEEYEEHFTYGYEVASTSEAESD